MTSIVGIREGHRIITTVTGRGGTATIDRQHHPDCPCLSRPAPSARIARRRKPTTRWTEGAAHLQRRSGPQS